MSVTVKAYIDDSVYNFILRPASEKALYPTFLSLCDELVYQLRLSTSPAALADPLRADFHLWTLAAPDRFEQICDDASLRAALSRTPAKLRLKLVPSTRLSAVAPDPMHMPCPNPHPVDSPTALLRLFHHVHNHATSLVAAELAAVTDRLVHHRDDAARLRKARHEVATLFTPFLHGLATTTPGKLSKSVYAPLQADLTALLRQCRVSEDTIATVTNAVRAVCNCRIATDLIRQKYAELACEGGEEDVSSGKEKKIKKKKKKKKKQKQKKQKLSVVTSATGAVSKSGSSSHRNHPIKFYTSQFARLLREGSDDVRDEYYSFLHALRHNPADEYHPFALSRRLCRAVQRESFHFLRCHVSDAEKLQFENKTVRALVNSIWRKLLRAGCNEKLGEYVSRIIVAMVMDAAVLKLAYSWANNLEEMTAVPIADKVKDVLGKGEYFREKPLSDQEWPLRDRESFRMDHEWPTYDPDERYERRVRIPERLGREESDRGEKGRYRARFRSASRDSQDSQWSRGSYSRAGSRRRGRKHRRYRDNSSDDTTISRHSRQGRNRKRLDISMDRPNKYEGFFSPVHSSEELPPLGVDPEELLTMTSSEESSSDTDRSQWGRIEMEKERELEIVRLAELHQRLAAERKEQHEREKRQERQLAAEREEESQLEDGGQRGHHTSGRDKWFRGDRSSRKRSHGSPRASEGRGRGKERDWRRRSSPEPDSVRYRDSDRYRDRNRWDDSPRRSEGGRFRRTRSHASVPDSGSRDIRDSWRRSSVDDEQRHDDEGVFRQEW